MLANQLLQWFIFFLHMQSGKAEEKNSANNGFRNYRVYTFTEYVSFAFVSACKASIETIFVVAVDGGGCARIFASDALEPISLLTRRVSSRANGTSNIDDQRSASKYVATITGTANRRSIIVKTRANVFKNSPASAHT